MTSLQITKRDDGIVVVCLNEPEALNALGEAQKHKLLDALNEIDGDESIRVVLLTASGRAFSAGGDVREMGAVTAAQAMGRVTLGNLIIEKIVSMRQIVVAGVNGLASGAGFNLALASDIIIADKSAWFQQSFIQIGLAPDMGGTFLLAQQLGWHRAKEAILTGRRFTSDEAHELGFVAEVIDGDFREEALRYCGTLASRPPLALWMAKSVINAAAASALHAALVAEASAQGILSASDDHKRAVEAFQSKQDIAGVTFEGR
jgi:2-(1,2-epoxy-1,2-dihydrophenyl)acetyl-CoA isomerase|tara:strand:- start:1055 stop:1837 length:783 start_codon:yes stop_codon:yes gene_type:complete